MPTYPHLERRYGRCGFLELVGHAHGVEQHLRRGAQPTLSIPDILGPEQARALAQVSVQDGLCVFGPTQVIAEPSPAATASGSALAAL
jgi:hypothetical protein